MFAAAVDTINSIRSTRPVTLGFINTVSSTGGKPVVKDARGKKAAGGGAEPAAKAGAAAHLEAEREEAQRAAAASDMAAAALAVPELAGDAEEGVPAVPDPTESTPKEEPATAAAAKDAAEHADAVEQSTVEACFSASGPSQDLVEALFDTPGPLGLVWSHKHLGPAVPGAESKRAVVKAIRPGSVADTHGTLRAGMVLLAVNGDSVEGLDYPDIIAKIRDTRPVTLTLEPQSKD